MQKISAFVLGLGTILSAGFLAPGCGGGNEGSKDSGLSTGGIDGTGGSPALGGVAGGTSTGGNSGSGGVTGTGGTAAADGGPSGVDAGTSTVPACAGFNACGGSIVGTWKLPGKVLCGSAGSGTHPPSSCTASNNLADMTQSGTLTFSDSGTWVSAITFNGTETVTYPASCLDGGATCADRAATTPDAGMVGSCVENTSGLCVCTYTLDNMTLGGQGTYTTAGGRLSVVGSDPSSMNYCVQGNTLSWYAVNSSTGDEATQVYERQ